MGSAYGTRVREEERRKAKLEPEVQQALGRELRALYHEVLSEPVPDKFRQLLDQLEDQEKSELDAGARRDGNTKD